MTHSTDDFDYALPEALIAQKPAEKREESRLLIPGVNPQIVPFRDIRQSSWQHLLLLFDHGAC